MFDADLAWDIMRDDARDRFHDWCAARDLDPADPDSEYMYANA